MLASFFAHGRATAYVKQRSYSAKFLGCLLFDLIWQINLAWTVALLSRILVALS